MIDKYGLYVQANGGNGDSAHRTGLVLGISCLLAYDAMLKKDLLAALNNRTTAMITHNTIRTHLDLGKGVYIRHPSDYEGDWSNKPSNFSRDQASRIIFGCACFCKKEEIKSWLWAMAKRGFFHQNYKDPTTNKTKIPDIMAPGEWRNVIRGMSLWWAYPILVLLDFLFIADIYLRKPWDGASLYVPDLKFALLKYWTPTAWLANKLNDDTTWLEEALNNHSLKENGCVELIPLFEKLARIK